MLLAAREFHCLAEMVILAAALSIQDPRDRPQDKREASDRAHEEFRDDASRLPAAAQPLEVLRRRRSSTRSPTASSTRPAASTSSRTCACASGATWPGSCARWPPSSKIRENTDARDLRAGPPRAAHRPARQRRPEGAGGRPLQRAARPAVRIWPGSGLKKNRPRWVMAGELQETTRVYRAQRRAHRARVDREGRRRTWSSARTSSRTGTRRAARWSAYENVCALRARARRAPQGELRAHRPGSARARSSSRARWSRASSRRRTRSGPHNRELDPRDRGPRAPRAPPRRAGRRPRPHRLLRRALARRTCAMPARSTPGTATAEQPRDAEAPLPRAAPTSCATAPSR